MRRILLIGLGVMISHGAVANTELWKDIENNISARGIGDEVVSSDHYNSRQLTLEESEFRNLLNGAPMESSAAEGVVSRGTELIIELPLPSGETVSVNVVESPILGEELAAEYPDIKTWKVIPGSNSKVASGRLDYTEKGFHGILTMLDGDTVYIEPEELSSSRIYHSLSHTDNQQKAEGAFACEVEGHDHSDVLSADVAENIAARIVQTPGNTLKTVKLAVAAAGEFTNAVGGTKAAAVAAITTIVNRANEIYQRDVAVKLELVGNDSIIYTDASSDPYAAQTASSNTTITTQNQTNLDMVVGSGNYDVGQVFTYMSRTASSGLAAKESACNDAQKGQAVAGFMGDVDVFAASMFAHELGHQFGGTHSFNSNLGACSTRTAASSWEPGSGSTIMSYAGVCGTDNLQPAPDPFFHGGTIEQIRGFVDSMSCGTTTSLTNKPPVAEAGSNFTIPANTAFVLKGTGSDEDGDALTYSWEQYNNTANASNVGVDTGNNAILRAYPPAVSSERAITSLAARYSGGTFPGETLPTSARSGADAMKMLLVVRDQKSGVDIDDMSITVDAASGPFNVTSHAAAVQMAAGSSQTVTWNVANTNNPPVSCSNVSVSLLTGDPSYGDAINKTVLASAVANDGSQVVTIPASTPVTKRARFAVDCDNNIFGALSAVNLGINAAPEAPVTSPTFTTEDTQVYEGNFDGQTQMKFKVTMSPAMTTEQQVQYTVRHTDTDGDDFFTPTVVTPGGVPIFGQTYILTFSPGQTTAYAVLNITGDTTVEANETFKFQLYIGNTRIADVVGTILDDDTPAKIASFTSNVTVAEVDTGSTSNAVFTVSLDGAPASNVTVNYTTVDGTAKSASDYTAQSGTLTFTPTDTSKTITVPIVGDAIFEGSESFSVQLSSPSVGLKFSNNVATLSATATITDNESAPKLSIADASIKEGAAGANPTLKFTVSLAGSAQSDVTVKVASQDSSPVSAVAGVDYVALASQTLTFKPGETSKEVNVTITGDADVEGNETFEVALSGATIATIQDGTAVGTIQDDEIIIASIDNVTKVEGNTGSTSLDFTVTLSSAPSSTVTVDYATVEGTAKAGADFTAKTGKLTFLAGETTKTITIAVTPDTIAEDNETFAVKLSSPLPVTDLAVSSDKGEATGTIENDDAHATVNVAITGPASIVEGNTGTTEMTFEVKLATASTQEVGVEYKTSAVTATSGADFTASSGTLTFAPGETSKNVVVKVTGDSVYEADETFKVGLSNPTGKVTSPGLNITGAEVTATITNDDSNSVSIADVTVNEGAGNAVLTLTLEGVATQDLSVKYSTAADSASSSDFTPASDITVNFTQGGPVTQTINIPVNDDSVNEGNETFKVNLSAPSTGLIVGTGTATVTIEDNDISVVSVKANAAATVAEGSSASGTVDAEFDVSLTVAAANDVTVNYTTSDDSATVANSDYVAATSGSIVIKAGDTSGKIVVKVNSDTTVENNETFKVTLTGVTPSEDAILSTTATDLSATGTITNDDKAKVSISDVTVNEGDFNTTATAEFTVALDQASTQVVTVDVVSEDVASSAEASVDYVALASTQLSFAVGETSKKVKVTVNGDWFIEADETFKVKLSNPSAALLLGDSEGVGTIKNDEVDTNNDGISDKQATDLGLDPAKADTDGDSVSDVVEIGDLPLKDTNNDGVIDATDTDSDGVIDALEFGTAADKDKQIVIVAPSNLGLDRLDGVKVDLLTDKGTLSVDSSSPALTNESSFGGAEDPDYDYPNGLLNIKLTGLTPGESAKITIAYSALVQGGVLAKADGVILDDGAVVRVLDKNNQWQELVGATITNDAALFTVTDGGDFDQDKAEDGKVSYIAGIGERAIVTGTGSSGGGALSLNTLLFISLFAMAGLVRRRKESSLV